MKPLPKPNVEMAVSGGPMGEKQVRSILCNPIYAGIGPCPRLVDDET